MSISPIEPSRPRRDSRGRLLERFVELAPAVRRAFDVRPGPGERDEWLSLTGHQLEALAALHERSLTMGALCDRLDISESAGTALSDRLVARGMVARETDAADRRVVRLTLTDEARAMVERYRQIKRTRAAEVLSSLCRDDLERLVRIYETLVAASERDATPSPLGRGGRNSRTAGIAPGGRTSSPRQSRTPSTTRSAGATR